MIGYGTALWHYRTPRGLLRKPGSKAKAFSTVGFPAVPGSFRHDSIIAGDILLGTGKNVGRTCLSCGVEISFCWCRRGDSNPHGFPHHPLKMACLPVPPLRHGTFIHIVTAFANRARIQRESYFFFTGAGACFSAGAGTDSVLVGVAAFWRASISSCCFLICSGVSALAGVC